MTTDTKTRRVKRGKKKYVSPFRQTDEQKRGPRPEVTCFKCKLPSYRGLPPFQFFGKDEDNVKLYGHAYCPQEPEALLVAVNDSRARQQEMWSRTRKMGGQVVSYHKDEDGTVIRKVIA